MRRWLIYIFLLAATPVLGLVLFKGTDIAKLQPVEVVSLSIQEGQLQIQTDTGNMGIGSTCKQAWEDLQNAATGVVFLDTADYLTVAIYRGDVGISAPILQNLFADWAGGLGNIAGIPKSTRTFSNHAAIPIRGKGITHINHTAGENGTCSVKKYH